MVVGVSKIDMMRSEPPSRVIVKKEKILDDSEIEMIKYLGLNLNEKPELLESLSIKKQRSASAN